MIVVNQCNDFGPSGNNASAATIDAMTEFEHRAPSARELLLKLLVARANRANRALDAADAIRACALFGITANSVRVALNRLLVSGLVESVGRGQYRLGPAGAATGREVAQWRQVADRLQPWDGSWVLALPPRGERKAMRDGQRALDMLGFRALDAGLYVRPDNLAGSVPRMRERLLDLGLDANAHVLQARELDATREAQARRLWDTKAIAAGYTRTQRLLQASLARLPQLAPDEAARLAWHDGDAAIRQLVFDPLLPEPLVSTATRDAFIASVVAYDQAGLLIWRRVLDAPAAADAQT